MNSHSKAYPFLSRFDPLNGGTLPSDLFHVFNDVIFPAAEGTSQIDHVVVSKLGCSI